MKTAKNRQIRIFISSTFRDMMRERDLLVKQVFPELRRICAKRFVTFTEVDLRWGITEEQAAEGQVLPLCLAEIERSRPYFIGLLGERYGWVPDAYPPQVIESEPWLKEHVEKGKSVTELEILHGVLNNPEMAGHAFFYFRDPAYVNDPSLHEDERRDMVERNIEAEVEQYGEAEASLRTEQRRAKLTALKERIRKSEFPVVDPYANPEALAENIKQQFIELIDQLYPEDQTPDPLAQKRMAHEAHAKNKLYACIDRPEHMAALDAFAGKANHGGKGLVVTGESGGGKTALLAAWAQQWSEENPDDFLFQHYFGATPDSSSPDGFLRRLLDEIKVRFEIPDEIPTDPDKLREALPLWLSQTVGKGRIVLVLDGLNQLRGSEPDRYLHFLPRHFPPHITVLASALPGPALGALCEHGWDEHDLPRANVAEVDAMIGEYFRLLGRHVDTEGRPIQTPLRQQLVAAAGCKNPLFLRTVLEELRQFGSFEQLPAHVASYLQATTPKELLLAVLRRWQEDFDGKDPTQENFDLTHRALTHLWAAREGLSEPEWLDLLGNGKEPMPRAKWTPLFLALEPHLSQREGLFTYGHDYLRQAVAESFLDSNELQKIAHIGIADYFENHPRQQEMSTRKAAERPFQLNAAESWGRLETCLTEIPLFLTLYNEKTKWELAGYWIPLRQKNGRNIGQCYATSYAEWKKDALNEKDYRASYLIGTFLYENGVFHESKNFLKETLDTQQQLLGSRHFETIKTQTVLAEVLESMGSLNDAEPIYRQAQEALTDIYGRDHPNTLEVLNNLAGLLDRKGELREAGLIYLIVYDDRIRMLGTDHPDTLVSMNNLAGWMYAKKDHGEAIALYREALGRFKSLLGEGHKHTLICANNLAVSLTQQNDNESAETIFRSVLKVQNELLGAQNPDTLLTMTNLANCLKNTKEFDEAKLLYRDALDGFTLALGMNHTITQRTRDALVALSDRVSKPEEASKKEPLESAGEGHTTEINSDSRFLEKLEIISGVGGGMKRSHHRELKSFVKKLNRKILDSRELSRIESEYIDSLNSIKASSERIMSKLPSGDPWRYVFETIQNKIRQCKVTIHTGDVSEHIYAFLFLVVIYNRCAGYRSRMDWMVGGREKRIMQIAQNYPIETHAHQNKISSCLLLIKNTFRNALTSN